jgi:hypothetical protein
MGVLLGFDPGGLKAFGWCIVEDAERPPLRVLTGGIVDNAQEAVEAVRKHLPHQSDVLAAGIDSPLFWTTSDRRVDSVLRAEVKTRAPDAARTVQAVNSLQGACLVQGVLLGQFLRDLWPDLPISESHPKAYLWLKRIANDSRRPGSDTHVPDLSRPPSMGTKSGGHVRDSAIAALSAWAMIHKPPEWRDLFLQEERPYMPIGPPLGYWMPELQA